MLLQALPAASWFLLEETRALLGGGRSGGRSRENDLPWLTLASRGFHVFGTTILRSIFLIKRPPRGRRRNNGVSTCDTVSVVAWKLLIALHMSGTETTGNSLDD